MVSSILTAWSKWPSGGTEYTLVLETSAFVHESSNLSSATKKFGRYGRNGLPPVLKTGAPQGWGFDSSTFLHISEELGIGKPSILLRCPRESACGFDSRLFRQSLEVSHSGNCTRL